MSLTFAKLLSAWTSSAGSDESSGGISAVDGVNQALTHLSNMWQWEGMVRSAIDLATVSGQSYIDLPEDCQEVLSIQYPSSYLQAVNIVGQEALARARTLNQEPTTSSDSTYFGALSWRVGDTGSVPILDTWPDQSVTASDTFRITYRARIVLTGTGQDADTAYIPIPPYLETLAIRLVRLFAKAFEEEDDGTLEARLQALSTSAFFYDAQKADGFLHPEAGGLADALSGIERPNWTDIGLSDPT